MPPVYIESVHGVNQRFVAHGNLAGKRFLVKMHKGTAYLEILAKVIHPVYAGHGLALHAEFGVAFQLYVYAGAGINYALVYYGDCTHAVIDGIVTVLNKSYATCCNYYGATRNIV